MLLHTSIRENIGIGLSFRGADKDTIHQKVDHWLDVFGISHLSNRQAYQLSGGEAQRVSLARAFATGADLLLLDEPFSSLDAPTRLGLLNDFQSILKSSRQTAIFITHDLDEALMLGSQIAILIGGQLRQVGSPRQVFDEPADSEVADFVGVETIISGEICTQKDGLVEVQTGDHLLEAVSDYQVGKMVYLCLRPEDITITLTPGHEQTSARNHLQLQNPRYPAKRTSFQSASGFRRCQTGITGDPNQCPGDEPGFWYECHCKFQVQRYSFAAKIRNRFPDLHSQPTYWTRLIGNLFVQEG